MSPTQKRLSWVLVALSVAVPVLALFWPDKHAAKGWLATCAIVAAFMVVAGKYCTDLWRGVLLDKGNLLSLSRFQMAIWTLVILPGWFAIVFHNMATGSASQALDVTIPNQVFVLLGITSVALVGSPLIKGEKMLKTPPPPSASASALPPGKALVGVVAVNKSAADASWGDMLKGEGQDDCNTLDLGKVQMFLFTLLLALGYAFSFGEIFAEAHGAIRSLPPIDEGMSLLLGISNTAYLTNKAASK